MAPRKSKPDRLEELKTNLKIYVFGVQAWVKQHGTAHFEDESSFKKYRRGLDEIINSSFTLNTGLITSDAQYSSDMSDTCLDHIYSRARISDYILMEAIWPKSETPLDEIIDRDAHLWVSVARVTSDENSELRTCITDNKMDYFDVYEMKHYKELGITLKYNDVTGMSNEKTDRGYTEYTNDVKEFPEIIYDCEVSSVIKNMADVPWFEIYSSQLADKKATKTA